jgi:glycine hydroxymethyltransferase
MKEAEFEFIANKIADILDDINNTELQEKVKKELEELASKFVVYTKSTY